MPCLSMSQFLLISHAKWCRLKLCKENYLSWNYCVSWFAYLTCCDSFKILKLSRDIHKPLKTPRKTAFEIIASVKISWKTWGNKILITKQLFNGSLPNTYNMLMLFIQEEGVPHIWKMMSYGSPGCFKHILEKKKRKKKTNQELLNDI